MKILFLSRLFYPHIGGVEKHVFEISKRLVKEGHKVTVITEKYRVNLESYKIYKEIKIHRIPLRMDNWFRKFFIWYWLWKNRVLIESVDIVHCHDVTFWFFPFKLFYFKKPLFTTFHGYESYPISKKAIAVRKISELMSWGNICIGDYIPKWYGTKATFISHGGVDSKKFKVLASRRSEQSSKFKVGNRESALFIGRLDKQTNILDYCEAVREIRKRFPKFKFMIAGDGILRNEAKAYGKVLGFVRDPEKMFDKHHFAFVSRYLSILEAMAAKRLVFAVYDNPLKKDYLEMAEFSKYIDIVGSSEQLVKKILYYLDYPDRERKIVSDAYQWVKNQSWDRVTKTYLDLWQRDY